MTGPAAADYRYHPGDAPPAAALLTALRRLDGLIARAVTAAQAAFGPEAAADPFRGLHIGLGDVERLLAWDPGAPLVADGRADEIAPMDLPALADEQAPPGLRRLRQVYALSAFDLDIILIALAPELDLRYERLYSYLQDDVSRRRPSVDLALNVLCTSPHEKLIRRSHFAPDAPLLSHGLVRLIADPGQPHPPLLAHILAVDEQIMRLVLGEKALDARLQPCFTRSAPSARLDDLSAPPALIRTLRELLWHAQAAGRPLRLCFAGPRGVGKRLAGEALATEAGAHFLYADLAEVLAASADFAQTVRLAVRAADFDGAMLYLDGLDTLSGVERAHEQHVLLETVAASGGTVILAGTQPWQPPVRSAGSAPLGVVSVAFSPPGFAERRASWDAALHAAGVAPLPSRAIEQLASRYRLTSYQITEAVAAAQHLMELPDGTPETAGGEASVATGALSALVAAARAQTGSALAAQARKIEPLYRWDDIVLPADAVAQLREMCRRVARQHRVLEGWGFARKLSLGRGVNALFAGPTGTGKTMAAEIIANELELDLYKIDLSGVVSKYIGETEKNLDRVFTAAESANAILFFDEADALFGKRSEVRDSHDRYANIEIAYLLQKMEQYEGITILATNLRGNLDEAFARRLTFTVHFPFPDEASRRRIWEGIWPPGVALAADVDLDALARGFKLSGGNIKNVALAAAFLAAEAETDAGEMIALAHLLHAIRREYQKMGKTLTDAELAAMLSTVALTTQASGDGC